ncbi:MAG: preprotein translocase subunit YajC [Bacteroidota bacterium]
MQLINLIVLQGGGFAEIMTGMWPFFLIIIVFYFFIIRPQSKRQKEQNTFQDDLEKGDKVVTASGIIGQINKIEEQEIVLLVESKTYIRVLRSAISKDMTESFLKKDDDNDKKS